MKKCTACPTAAEPMGRLRHTNALHCRPVNLARKIEAPCKGGIEDNLDPRCVDVFQKSLAHAYEMMKMAMTEMQTCIARGKRG